MRAGNTHYNKTMRMLLLVTATLACALLGWVFYGQPISASNDKGPTVIQASQPSQPDRRFGSYGVAETKREWATLAECEEEADKQRLSIGYNRSDFIEQCLKKAANSAPPDRW